MTSAVFAARSRRSPIAIATAITFVLTAAFGSLSCERMPLTAPSGTFITLLASSGSIPADGSAEITAILTEGGFTPGDDGNTVTPGVGTPVHNGTVVTFFTTLGRIEPTEAGTQGGKVTVRIFGDGRSGTAKITAISGPASQTLELAIGTSTADRVSATASPSSLPAGGGESTIQARVIDIAGNSLSGVTVSFAATAGTIAPSSAATNASGTATATLDTTATSEVTVSTVGPAGTISAKVTVTVAS
jgi:hypothetical protein